MKDPLDLGVKTGKGFFVKVRQETSRVALARCLDLRSSEQSVSPYPRILCVSVTSTIFCELAFICAMCPASLCALRPQASDCSPSKDCSYESACFELWQFHRQVPTD